MEKYRVSVLVPVYNVEKYIEKCLESIVNQSYSNLEILLIDDGSTDSSLSIIKKYADSDSRIQYKSRENRGLLPTRLELAELCSGDFFAFVDSDDWIELEYISKLVDAAERTGADIVRCGDVIEHIGQNRITKYCKADKGGCVIVDRDDFSDSLLYDLMNAYYYNSIHSVLARRSFVEDDVLNIIRKNSCISIGEDVVFNCAMYHKAKRIVTIPEYLYHYRKNPMSIMNTVTSIEKYKKRLNDCYMTQLVIFDLVSEINIEYEPLWNQTALREINFCVDEFIKNCDSSRQIIEVIRETQNFVKGTKLHPDGERREKYLFKNKVDVAICIQKLVFKRVELCIKQEIKALLYALNYERRVSMNEDKAKASI